MVIWKAVVASVAQLLVVMAQDDNLTRPFSIGSPAEWVGPDGPWAFFGIAVGVGMGQDLETHYFRAFPALSLSITLLPLTADFCNGSRRSDLACVARGSNHEEGTQAGLTLNWEIGSEADVLSQIGLQNLVDFEHRNTSRQSCGTDSTIIRETGAVGTTNSLQNLGLIAGTDSKTFFMTLLGLSNEYFSLGRWAGSPSLLSSLADSDRLPGKSVSYTAGCFARTSPASLVLGGYDSTRLDPKTTLKIGLQDTIADADLYQLAVNITAITIVFDRAISGNINNYKSQDISVDVEQDLIVNIDPLTSYIWLPKFACDAFEQAFRLEWNAGANLYFVNESNHDWLLQTNQSVVISLSSSRSKGAVQNYTLPYRTAFYLNITYPYVDSWSHYFPLRRSDDSNYGLRYPLLGRAFFQEMHISVDYDRGYFNLSQSTPGSNQENIVTIRSKDNVPKGDMPEGDVLEDDATNKPHGLTAAAYAGIGAGASILAISISLLALSWTKKWETFRKATLQKASGTSEGKAELHHDGIPRTGSQLEELTAEKETKELETSEPTHEVSCSTDLSEVNQLDTSSRDSSLVESRG